MYKNPECQIYLMFFCNKFFSGGVPGALVTIVEVKWHHYAI
jgi:hypothetical protein